MKEKCMSKLSRSEASTNFKLGTENWNMKKYLVIALLLKG